jgi:tight adherence protein C
VEAGLGFDAAVGRVAKNTKGPLAQEFARLLQEMQIGVGRAEAMRAVAERTTLPDLKSFCLAMVQADNLGVPIGRVLRIQSKEMRVKRRQRAEEKAMQVPVKIMIPLVLFILPCLFLVVLGPAGMSIAETFSEM